MAHRDGCVAVKKSRKTLKQQGIAWKPTMEEN